jgi:hypothetical protein
LWVPLVAASQFPVNTRILSGTSDEHLATPTKKIIAADATLDQMKNNFTGIVVEQR